MSNTYVIDAKKRIVLTDAQPGEVIDVEYLGGGSWRLRRAVGQSHFNPSDAEEPCCSNCGGNHTESDCRESIED